MKCRSRASNGASVTVGRDAGPDAGVPVSMADDNHSACSVLGGEAACFPILVGHMLHQTEMELVGRAHSWSFRDVLDRLIIIAGNPVRHALGQVIDTSGVSRSVCSYLLN